MTDEQNMLLTLVCHLTAMNTKFDVLYGLAKFIDKFGPGLGKHNLLAVAVADRETDNSFYLLNLAAQSGLDQIQLDCRTSKIQCLSQGQYGLDMSRLNGNWHNALLVGG